jgi:GntR family transcriptional repressor for pyruvate dehydrogenase complex
MFEPVARRSVTDAVFDQLRELILGGDVGAGDKLPAERELATRLGVNRNAVREALQRLAQLRLVSIHPGGATRILDFRAHGGLELLSFLLFGRGTAPRAEAIRSMVELRTALGPDIAARAALRRPDDAIPRMTAIVERMSPPVPLDPAALQVLSMELWRILVDSSDNVAYALLFNTLDQAYLGVADVVAPALAAELTDLASFRALVRAVEAKDDKAARRVADRLLARGEAGIVALLSTERTTKTTGRAAPKRGAT